ncbi:hypothetical protein EYF80_060379 [Liparis tanakae]|uniref:Uncharacterized protein n=1 Tax=Liparis tanakae TaxID=230148 RepID=A0A4Z2ELM8_9TELE|nr:hypothetical protein EYF80_060379 [Liparis tanakae]
MLGSGVMTARSDVFTDTGDETPAGAADQQVVAQPRFRKQPLGVLACWRVGVLASWRVACWRVGVLACWRVGVLASWRVAWEEDGTPPLGETH